MASMASKKPITNGYINNVEMEKILIDVATNIGNIDWKRLARRLEVPEGCIQNIDDEFQKIDEKVYQALLKWLHMFGHSGATKDVLIKAIRKESNLLADEICQRHDIEASVECTELYEKHILSMGTELTSLLSNSQMNLSTCDSATLGQRQRTLQHLNNMEKILFEMIENYERKPLQSTTAQLIGDAKTDCHRRMEHTKQTMRLIQHLLHKITTSKVRGKAGMPKRCRSFADLRLAETTTRTTYSRRGLSAIDISSPIFVRKIEEP